MKDNPGARVLLPDTSVEEPERSGLLVTDGQLRERLSCEAGTSTPIKSHVPVYNKRSQACWKSVPTLCCSYLLTNHFRGGG